MSNTGTNTDQPGALPAMLASAIRTAMQFGGGYLASHGVIASDQQQLVVGAGLAVAGLAWSIFQKWNATKALKAAIAAPSGKAA